MKRCYIIGAGEFYGTISPNEDDLVIAADGGLDTLTSLGISPDIFLGDMDSVNTDFNGETIRFPVKKDETDSFLAYCEGAKRGYSDFVIFGGTGGREDHTFANLSLLLYAKEHGHTMRLVGKKNESFVIKNETVTLSGKEGLHFSAFAFGGIAEGVCINGLEYSADNITLTPEFPLAVSNRFIGSDATVSVRDGALLIMTERE